MYSLFVKKKKKPFSLLLFIVGVYHFIITVLASFFFFDCYLYRTKKGSKFTVISFPPKESFENLQEEEEWERNYRSNKSLDRCCVSTRMSTVLHVVISEKVNRSNRTASVTWQVPTRQPLIVSWQAGDLSQRVGADVAQTCELCFYTGGIIGNVIDLNLTPETLGLTRANAVYLRPLQHASLGKLGTMASLTHEEVRRLNEDAKRLAEVLLPRLKPDDPCPVCNHSRNERNSAVGGAGGNTSRTAGLNESYSNSGSGGSPRGGGRDAGSGPSSSMFKYKPSVAVQCGIASGIDQPPIYIEFGKTGARMVASDTQPNDSGMNASGMGRRGGGGASSGSKNDRDVIHDLQMTIEDLKVKNTAQTVEIKEARKEIKELERWRSEHRCETNTNVGALRMQIEVLQQNLRELMRGRQEVFAILQERRRAGTAAGSALKGSPYEYAPFATSLPDLSFVDPHTLLSKADDPEMRKLIDDYKRKGAARGAAEGGNGNIRDQQRYLHDYNNPNATIGVELGKRPSNNTKGGGGDADLLFSSSPSASSFNNNNAIGGLNVSNALNTSGAWQHHSTLLDADRTQKRRDVDIEVCGQECLPGHCQLRINTTTGGDPFVVQRKITSHVHSGKNLITLVSLDGVVTDEIFVEELEMVAAPGRCGLVLGTRNYEWQLSFSPQERTNWVHWLYALNPWLTPHRPGAAQLAASY